MASLPAIAPADDLAGDELRPEQMDDSELVSILTSHENQSIGYQGADNDITAEQEKALAYYQGEMDDVPAMEGGSSVVDGTVALVVDNAVAALLKPFVSSDETVKFTPRGPEDEEIADQATEYVNYVFQCDNPGFLILHNWFKDALLSKLGVVKVWWEEETRLETQEIQLTDDLQAAFIRQQPNYLGEENGIAVLGQEVEDGRIKVVNVPPEEFRISTASRSIEDADYTAHVPANVSRSDLLEMGFDVDIVESLPAYGVTANESEVRDTRYSDENYAQDSYESHHKPNDRIAVRDEYVRIDYNGDGVSELRRIIRVEDTILLNEEVEDNPFACLCPIPMPHKVFGHSLADRAIQEQKIGTVLWRQALDNLYKSNNPRPIIGEGGERTDGSTLDDLMDNAPGAAIRVRDMGQFALSDAVRFTADKVFPMMELLDKKVEENTGISRAGQGLDTNALRKSGQMTAIEFAGIQEGKNARTEMIARVFAETGVSRLFKLILLLVSKYQPQERVVRLRNKWVPIDPRGWPEMDVAINVGLGIGDKQEQMAQANAVLEVMKEIGGSPYASLIDAEKVHNAVKRLFTSAGIKNTDEFLNDPAEMQQQPQQPDPEAMKMMAEQQRKQQEAEFNAELKAFEVQQRLMLEAMKAEGQFDLAAFKAQMEADLAAWKAQQEVRMKKDLPDNRPGGDLSK